MGYWADRKQRCEEKEKRREEEKKKKKNKRRSEERFRRKRSQKKESEKRTKEDAGTRQGRKAAVHCALPLVCGSGGLKRRLAKAAGAEPSGHMRDNQLHADVVRSTLPLDM